LGWILFAVSQDLLDDGVLGDERQELHRGIAFGTRQRVDLVDTVDELGPSLAQSAPWRRGGGGGFGWRGGVGAVGGSNAIGVSAIEMDQVFVGRGNMDQHARQELEGVETGLTVDVVSGFGLVEDELGVRMVAKSGEVHGRAHQVAGELVEPVGVGGIDGGAIVNAEA